MATKTFKIGLSNTDKQNMAQDIYEQVEQLLFDEYDYSATYHENDFVVYNDKLYICIASSTTGTWDATKWQEAKLQDLVDLVNEGVASISGKANTSDLLDGTIVVSKSLSAQELENVSEESGNTQEEPFIYQGTGTANGTASVDTSPVGKQLEKQGNSVVVNQWMKVITTTNSSFVRATGTIVDGVAEFTSTEANGVFQANGNDRFNVVQNHKYLCMFYAKSEVANYNVSARLQNTQEIYGTKNIVLETSYKQFILLVDYTNQYAITGNYGCMQILDANASDWAKISCKDFICIDLYQWFNGDIPQDILDHPENFSRYYQGSLDYNTGTLENADGRYLECGGRNKLNPEETYNIAIPSREYCYYQSSGTATTITFYDKDKNSLGTESVNSGSNFTTPANCRYFSSSTTSNATISLYYTTGDGYDQYYPYVAPKVYDTGTEVLRSAGSVKDIKKPDGAITRNVGVIDLSTLNWTATLYGFVATINDIIKATSNAQIGNILCNKYERTTYQKIYNQEVDKAISLRDKDSSYTGIAVRDTSLTGGETPTGYLYYELATTTTEQGTTFSENIEIDDYGTMGWKDTNEDYVEIPQGCKIFYPAWYAGFIDSLGQREDIEWDAGNIVSKDELTSYQPIMQDLSSEITDVAGLTYDVKKAYKLGNMVFLSISAINSTGSNISAETTLFTVSNNLKPIGYSPIFLVRKTGEDVRVSISGSNGNCICGSAINNNQAISICVSYAVA